MYEHATIAQIVEELLAATPTQCSQSAETDARTSDASESDMEPESVIQATSESTSTYNEQIITRRHARIQARPLTKSKGKGSV